MLLTSTVVWSPFGVKAIESVSGRKTGNRPMPRNESGKARTKDSFPGNVSLLDVSRSRFREVAEIPRNLPLVFEVSLLFLLVLSLESCSSHFLESRRSRIQTWCNIENSLSSLNDFRRSLFILCLQFARDGATGGFGFLLRVRVRVCSEVLLTFFP